MNFLTIPFIGRLPVRENTILHVKEEERYLPTRLSFFRSFECRLRGLANGHVIFTWSGNERFETSGSRRGNRERKSAEMRANIQLAKKSARWRKVGQRSDRLPRQFPLPAKEDRHVATSLFNRFELIEINSRNFIPRIFFSRW